MTLFSIIINLRSSSIMTSVQLICQHNLCVKVYNVYSFFISYVDNETNFEPGSESSNSRRTENKAHGLHNNLSKDLRLCHESIQDIKVIQVC